MEQQDCLQAVYLFLVTFHCHITIAVSIQYSVIARFEKPENVDIKITSEKIT